MCSFSLHSCSNPFVLESQKEIIEDIEQNILARYLPDSMLIERGLKNDVQVAETAKMLKDGREFDKILARDKDSLKEKGSVLTNAGSQSYQSTSTILNPTMKFSSPKDIPSPKSHSYMNL